MGYGNWPNTRNTSKWDMATGIGQLVAESQLPYPPGGPRFLEASEKHMVLHESSIVVMSAAIGPVPRGSNNPYKFIGFGAMEVTKACGVWGHGGHQTLSIYRVWGHGCHQTLSVHRVWGHGGPLSICKVWGHGGFPVPPGASRPGPAQPAGQVRPAGRLCRPL